MPVEDATTKQLQTKKMAFEGMLVVFTAVALY
jgi:hypothetical protein